MLAQNNMEFEITEISEFEFAGPNCMYHKYAEEQCKVNPFQLNLI